MRDAALRVGYSSPRRYPARVELIHAQDAAVAYTPSRRVLPRDRRRNPNKHPRLQTCVVHGRFTEAEWTLLRELADIHRCSMAECMRKGVQLFAKDTPKIEETRKAEVRRLEIEREAEARREKEDREFFACERRRLIDHFKTPEGQEELREYERQHGPQKTQRAVDFIHGDEERYIQEMLRQSRAG